jgi:DNA polymerase-3 subunit gamma/tau
VELAQAPATGAAASEPAVGVVADDLEGVAGMWPAVVELVRGENALVGAVVGEARPVAVSGDDLTLAFATTAPFLKKKAEDPNNRMIVGEALRAVTGRRWRLSYELREELSSEQAPHAQSSEEDWIRRFMDEFDAEEVPLEWEPDPADAAAQGETGAHAATSYQKGA